MTACDDGRCVVCAASPGEEPRPVLWALGTSLVQQNPTGVQQVLPPVRRRDPFPSLSLMSKPITPAPPRLRPFSGMATNHGLKWRCRVEVADICRHRRITSAGLTVAHYAATGPEGWGDTKERAYRAWESKWRACMEKTYRE